MRARRPRIHRLTRERVSAELIPATIRGILAALLFAGAASTACSDGGGATAVDAAAVDATAIDATLVDAAPDAAPEFPHPGFGAITGACHVIGDAELDGTTPLWFQGELDFGTNRYDDPAERDQLTPGGRHIVEIPNAGGSSVFSEAFAFEWLARCEDAELLKTETEIVYDVAGKKADLLVAIDGRKVGVSVTRFVAFPFGNPYTADAATTLITRKIEDLRLATAEVSAADHWSKQMVAAEAYDLQHAQVAMAAWAALDAQTRGDTMFVVMVTSGDDLFIYTDQ